MTTDDLRKRAREAAEERLRFTQFPTYTDTGREVARAIVNTFVGGALWHAAQQPSREEVAEMLSGDHFIEYSPGIGLHMSMSPVMATYFADAVLRLLNGEENA